MLPPSIAAVSSPFRRFSGPVGLFAAAIASFTLVPVYGWRALFVVGVVPAFLAFFVIRTIPESPRWLASKGRTKEAAAVLMRLGADAER